MNRVLGALAVVAVLGASFFTGHQSYGVTSEFEHADVMDVANSCGEGQFIGGCATCKTCDTFEYKAGGCSYFKDTFCTLCEPINHCPQDNISCTANDDEVCSQCDPGYYDVDCKPCTVCDPGFYEVQKCSQDSDSVCVKCTEEDPVTKQHLTQPCSYFEDAVWSDCNGCNLGTFEHEKCETTEESGLEFPASVYTVQPDTRCRQCSEPEEGSNEFVSEVCNVMADTKFTDCTVCEDGKFSTQDCQAGVSDATGTDTVCQGCTKEKAGEWQVFPCGGKFDGLFKPCSECQPGEYLHSECDKDANGKGTDAGGIPLHKDTECPACRTRVAYGQLENCKEGELRCTDDKDTTCGDWTQRDMPTDVCEEGWFGATCGYHRHGLECGTLTTRERAANRGGYEGNSNEEFIQFCLELCDEFPDCMAFELEDGGSSPYQTGNNSFDGRDATCYFKSSYTQELCDRKEPGCDARTKSRYRSQCDGPDCAPALKDCYSNVIRQNAAFNSYFPQLAKYDPCRDKEDGDTCTICAPGTDCLETRELKTCTDGTCSSADSEKCKDVCEDPDNNCEDLCGDRCDTDDVEDPAGVIFGDCKACAEENSCMPCWDCHMSDIPEEELQLVGGDLDDNGCLAAGGFTWCEAKSKCLRTWEEPCE